MKRKRFIDNQCNHCGVFCKYEEMDSYTPFGCSHHDPLEPLDPIVICKKCSEKIYNQYKEQFARGEYQYGDWHKSNAERKAAKEARLVWIGGDSNIEYKGQKVAYQYIPKEIYEKQLNLLESKELIRSEYLCK